MPIPDKTPSPVPPPTVEVGADVSFPGLHLLELHIKSLPAIQGDRNQSDYGVRIYYGIMPPGGATVEVATGQKRELMYAPTVGDELPHSVFTRTKKHQFDFDGDSGKTAYFCLRYENAKGEVGPFGPLLSAVIP
jgi:hypothetical protein